jgi:hypothetical protein
MMPRIEQARLKELLFYDETSGIFTWKKRAKSASRIKIGAVAGSPIASGYWYIRLDGKTFRAHRLAWFYVHGTMPPAEIDHIDGDSANNRIANLRLATRVENQCNSRTRKSASGLKGAHSRPGRNAWSSAIQKNGKRRHLGYFATAEEAHAAYVKAATKLHGEFARAA